VHEYLEEQLQKMLITRPGYIHHSLQRLRKKNMGVLPNASKRKMSYRGSIRRTRSIHFDNPEMTAAVKGNWFFIIGKIFSLPLLCNLKKKEISHIIL